MLQVLLKYPATKAVKVSVVLTDANNASQRDVKTNLEGVNIT